MTKNIVYDNSNIYLIYCCISSILLYNYSRISKYWCLLLWVYICIFCKYLMGLQSTCWRQIVCMCVNFVCCLAAGSFSKSGWRKTKFQLMMASEDNTCIKLMPQRTTPVTCHHLFQNNVNVTEHILNLVECWSNIVIRYWYNMFHEPKNILNKIIILIYALQHPLMQAYCPFFSFGNSARTKVSLNLKPAVIGGDLVDAQYPLKLHPKPAMFLVEIWWTPKSQLKLLVDVNNGCASAIMLISYDNIIFGYLKIYFKILYYTVYILT